MGLALTVSIVALGGAPAMAADEPYDGIAIDVQVIGPSASPSPSPSSSSTRAPSGGGSSNSPGPSPSSTPGGDLGDDAVDLGGVLYVGGLKGSITPTIAARGGVAQLAITVRNTSDELTTLKLRFWLQNSVGATIGEVSYLEARDLRPDETRTISASITTVGQWTFYTAHVTITPPKELDGVKLKPITRDATLLVPPYFLVTTGAAIALLYFAIRYLVLRRLLGLGVPA